MTATFLAIAGILFVSNLSYTPTNYLLHVEYNGESDIIRYDRDPTELKKLCDLGVMYLHPWNKKFDETPNAPGYWKVSIVRIEEIKKTYSIGNAMLISLTISFLSTVFLSIFGLFNRRQ